MKSSLAIAVASALIGSAMASHAALAQMTSPCDGFIKLRDDAQKKGMAIGAAQKRHADRKEICTLVSRFSVAEGAALKYLESNKTWCGIPDQVIAAARSNHEKTLKFRTVVCAPAPQPHLPSLSDAIGTPALDTAKNTKTGRGGTFDTLTGNPLAR